MTRGPLGCHLCRPRGERRASARTAAEYTSLEAASLGLAPQLPRTRCSSLTRRPIGQRKIPLTFCRENRTLDRRTSEFGFAGAPIGLFTFCRPTGHHRSQHRPPSIIHSAFICAFSLRGYSPVVKSPTNDNSWEDRAPSTL